MQKFCIIFHNNIRMSKTHAQKTKCSTGNENEQMTNQYSALTKISLIDFLSTYNINHEEIDYDNLNSDACKNMFESHNQQYIILRNIYNDLSNERTRIINIP